MRQVIRAFCPKIYCEQYHHAIFHRTVVPYSTLSFMNQGRKYRYIYYYYHRTIFLLFSFYFVMFFFLFFFILSNKVAWNRLLLKRSNSWQNLSWQDTTTIGGKSMPTPAATLHFSTHRHTVLVFSIVCSFYESLKNFWSGLRLPHDQYFFFVPSNSTIWFVLY